MSKPDLSPPAVAPVFVGLTMKPAKFTDECVVIAMTSEGQLWHFNYHLREWIKFADGPKGNK